MIARTLHLVFGALLPIVASAQATLELDAFKRFALSTQARMVSSSEIARIEDGPTTANITAVVFVDASRNTRRGIRIDLSNTDVSDRVFVGDDVAVKLAGTFSEIESAPAKQGCVGSCVFLDGQRSSVPFIAFRCQSGLVINTGTRRFEFATANIKVWRDAIENAIR